MAHTQAARAGRIGSVPAAAGARWRRGRPSSRRCPACTSTAGRGRPGPARVLTDCIALQCRADIVSRGIRCARANANANAMQQWGLGHRCPLASARRTRLRACVRACVRRRRSYADARGPMGEGRQRCLDRAAWRVLHVRHEHRPYLLIPVRQRRLFRHTLGDADGTPGAGRRAGMGA